MSFLSDQISMSLSLEDAVIINKCFKVMFFLSDQISMSLSLEDAVIVNKCFKVMFFLSDQISMSLSLEDAVIVNKCFKVMFFLSDQISMSLSLEDAVIVNKCFKVMFFLSDQISMAQKVLSTDMASLISAMKLAQQYSTTTMDTEYRKGMLKAAHALAVDSKNLLDIVDNARVKHLGTDWCS